MKTIRSKPFSKIKREYAELMHTGKVDCECDNCVDSRINQVIEEKE